MYSKDISTIYQCDLGIEGTVASLLTQCGSCKTRREFWMSKGSAFVNVKSNVDISLFSLTDDI